MDETADAMLISAVYDHTIRFWNIANGCCIRTLQHTESQGFSKNVTSIGFNKDMRWMYTGSEDFSARIWDLRTRTLDCQRTYQVNTPVNSVCLHPNQAQLFIGDQSGTSIDRFHNLKSALLSQFN